jgi:acetyl esterase/lipase
MRYVKYILLTMFIAGMGVFTAMAREGATPEFPVPQTASQELRALIASPAPSYWNNHPKTAQAWEKWVSQHASEVAEQLPGLREKMGVTVMSGQIAGVPVFTVTPRTVAPENKNRILLHFHGGGYVLCPGEAGTVEAILMAGYGHIKVLSVDYRMPPDFPYPAALDDAMAVYRELLKKYPPERIGVFGTSTGGGMTLALMLRAKSDGLPMPAALGAGTPWTDLTETGDSYITNKHVDNVLVAYEGWLGDAARLYANGNDLKTPMLSPIYGDVHGLPPTMLTAGTRDLFLSNTVRMHLKLRQAGVPAELLVFEGMSHAQYLMSVDAPETKLHFGELSRFFGRYLQ